MNNNLNDIKQSYFNDADRNYLNPNVSKKKQSLVNICLGLSIAYVVLWCIIFILSFTTMAGVNITEIIFIGIFGVTLFILGIILIDKVLFLKHYYFGYVRKDLYICFLLWWILFFPSFIGSILVIKDCIKIKKQNFNQLESTNENDSLNSIINKHSITLIETCRWCSISLIALWIIFAIVVFSYVFSNDHTLQVDGIIAGSILLGIILIVLSIILTIKTITLYNHFLPFAKGLYFWFLFWIFLWIPCFIGSTLTIIQCNKIKKQYKQYLDETLDKKIKKYLTITSTVVSSVMTVLGVGLVAGTYNSYNNYQLLTSIENQVNNMDSNKINSWADGKQQVFSSPQTYFVSCSSVYDFIDELVVLSKSTDPDCIVWILQISSPYEWNEGIQNLSDFQKENLNNVLQNQKKLFYGNYPLQQDLSSNSIESSANLTSKELYDIYSLQDYVYHLNLNYGANQASLIAGSVLIAIGLVALILSANYLGIIRNKEKKEQNNLLKFSIK